MSALMLTACGGNKEESKGVNVVGQWELMDIQATKAAQIGSETIEVYIDFKDDKTFSMWQKLGEGRHRKYTGTWELTENVLTGKYSDGKSWGTSYNISLDSGNLYMSEIKQNLETYVYKPCTIPAGL
jgi:hypothetical protein